jgi:hypothetical protein
VTRTIDLERRPYDNGLRNAWVAVASAVIMGTLFNAPLWMFSRRTPYFAHYVIVNAVVAFVLTPLAISLYLSLHELTTRLLRWLRDDGVIGPASAGERLDEFARALERRLNHVAVAAPTVMVTVMYLVYAVDVANVHLAWSPRTLLVAVALAAQAALFYLGIVAMTQLRIASQAIGKLLREFTIHVQPLHPDGCGGLWIVGHMFSLVLCVAAVLAGAGLCLILAWLGTDVVPGRRPELYVLGAFYVVLLPSAFMNLPWRPHQLMDNHRDKLLKPVTRVFDTAINRPSPHADADELRARGDSLSEITRQFKALDEVCPAWPLRTRRLGPVLVTAILPVAIPLLTTVVSKVLIGR